MKAFLSEVFFLTGFTISSPETNETVLKYYNLWNETHESMVIYMLVDELLENE